MSKRISFARVHYGCDYLHWVIKSTEQIADTFVVMYTPTPTFGRDTDLPNPDSRDELYAIAEQAAGSRLRWYDGTPDARIVLEMYPTAEFILELDADEVLHPSLADNIIREYEAGSLTYFQYRMPMIHHWRSFDYICTNEGWPGRLYLPNNNPSQALGGFPNGYEAGVISHFGYARRRADMLYKVALSVHLPEWREGWWENKYDRFPEVLTDLHPCVNDIWDAAPYDKRNNLSFMADHPYFDLEVID